MVPDTSRVTHAACRKDHLRPRIVVDLLGFLHTFRQVQIGGPERIDSLPQQISRFSIEIFRLALHENSRRRLSKRTVQIDWPAVVALHQPLLLDLADRVQKLLRSADRERRNDHAAAPVKGALQNSG